MKKRSSIYITLFTLMVSVMFGCSDWTDSEAKDFFEKPSEDYYKNLREYKKSDHQMCFGWFGNWTGKGSSMVNSMMGLPDSVDFVSIWGNWRNLDEARIEDKRLAKEVKGIRALVCFIVANVGDQLTPSEVRQKYAENGFDSESEAVKDFWGWVDGDDEKIQAAIDKYANAICDTIDKYDYDGFDIDYEPHYGAPGNLAGGPGGTNRMDLFVKALSKRIGPKSGTGRLLVVDGEPQSMPAETGPYFDYFIVQAYSCSGDANLDGRLNSTIENFKDVLTPEEVASRYIVTENFESLAQTGGTNFTDRYGNKMKSLEGMARWSPIIDGKLIRKGGTGTYHMEYDYPNQDATYMEYRYIRRSISIMNPSVK